MHQTLNVVSSAVAAYPMGPTVRFIPPCRVVGIPFNFIYWVFSFPLSLFLESGGAASSVTLFFS